LPNLCKKSSIRCSLQKKRTIRCSLQKNVDISRSRDYTNLVPRFRMGRTVRDERS
jgi:hypothetical protein